MSLGVTIISFSPNTVIKSADVNSNFSALNNAATFTGGGTFTGTLSADGGLITSDGAGNLNIPNTAHYNIAGFNVMWSPSSQNLELNVPNSGGSHQLNISVGGTRVAHIDSAGAMVLKGALTQNGTP